MRSVFFDLQQCHGPFQLVNIQGIGKDNYGSHSTEALDASAIEQMAERMAQNISVPLMLGSDSILNQESQARLAVHHHIMVSILHLDRYLASQ